MRTIRRPHFVSVPLATGLRWRGGGGFVYQEKLDGIWCVREQGGAILVGELVGLRFTAFDLVQLNGQDVSREPLRVRLELLRGLMVPMVEHGNGGEFLEAVLARGGEGVLAKDLAAPFGEPWFKCKRQETLDLRVIEMDAARGSLHLADITTGEDRGWCPAKAAFNAIAVGDVVEVAAHSIHHSGKLREARFVRLRPDKKRVQR